VTPFYQTKRFKREKRKWDRILERERFPDIERTSSHGTVLSQLSLRKNFKATAIEATQAYYSWANSIMWTRRFRRGLYNEFGRGRKTLWRLHAGGLSNSEIARRVGLSRWTVEDLLGKLREYLKGKP